MDARVRLEVERGRVRREELGRYVRERGGKMFREAMGLGRWIRIG